jgi:hypothetical protein
MKLGALVNSVANTSVLEFAKRIQRKRLTLATNPWLASGAPTKSGQGWLRRLGLDSIDIAASPELTLAKICQEWQRNEQYHQKGAPYRRQPADSAEAESKNLEKMNRNIAYIEYRVFGQNPNERYPKFSELVEWLAWRVQVAHPDHQCANPELGWTRTLYSFALSEMPLAFG